MRFNEVLNPAQDVRAMILDSARPVGFMPTMGFPHAGHLSLVRCARRANATVAVSIFVNPTQVGPHEDLVDYPRDMQRDLELLEDEGVDLVFAPFGHDGP